MLWKYTIIFTVLIILAYGSYLINKLEPFPEYYSTIIEDKDGVLLDASIAKDYQWRFPAKNDLYPKSFIKALIQQEDSRFFIHNGVDWFSILRAAWLNIKYKKIISGGSTITMQVIRLSQKNPPRTIIEKIKEIFYAHYLNHRYSKKEILKMYMLHAPFGGNVVGINAASYRYFGRSTNNLTWAESALLAVLPNNPAIIHPGKNRKILKDKRNNLLEKLHNKNIITNEQYKLAQFEDIPPKPYPFPKKAHHLLFHLAQSNTGIIKSTIDISLQEQIIRIINNHKHKLQGNNIKNIAALVIDIESNNVLAYIGNYSDLSKNNNGNHVDIIHSARSTGSVLKPFLYALMLTSGEILPKTIIPDIPVNYRGYSPKNFNRGYDGIATANRALARSLNVPAVKMLKQYGIEKFHENLQQLGMKHITNSAGHYGLSLILGGCEGSLWEICAVYASMARLLKGYRSDDTETCNYHYNEPNLLYNQQAKKKRLTTQGLLSPSAVYFTLQALIEAERPGAEVNWDFFDKSQKIAWKTGTSFGFRDGWAIGITSNHVIGVWVGNADGEGRPELTGVKTAAPVMFDIIKILPHNNQWFLPPYDDMTQAQVCKQSGYLASALCTEPELQYISTTGINSKPCPYHTIIHLDATEKFQVHASCEPISKIVSKAWFILPPLIEWFFKQKNAWYKPPPPFRNDCISTAEISQKNMQLIYPQNPSKIFLPIDFDKKQQKVVFEAAHRIPNIPIFWYINNNFVGETKHFHQIAVSPAIGTHKLVLTDIYGEILSINFEIVNKN